MAKKDKLGVLFFLLAPTLYRFFDLGADGLKKVMEKAFADKPGLVTEMVMAVYPFVDVFLEDYVKQTKNPADDVAVADLKKVIEEFSAAHGIELLNMDED